MRTEERTVFLAVLVQVAFGFLTWIDSGSFIFPFPLNEATFLIVALYFAYKHYQRFRNQVIFSSAFAVFNLAASDFLWSVLIGHDRMLEMQESGTFDLLKLMAATFLLTWAGMTLIRGNDKIRSSLFLVFFVTFCAGLIFDIQVLTFIAYLIPFGASFKYKDLYPFHLLWLLLSLLGLMQYSMLFWSL